MTLAHAAPERYCMFFGYPRSGHSLVGSLLNAHPEAVISHELDALALLREGAGREALFERILAHDAAFSAQGRRHEGFDYRVPGAWQGEVTRLRVIGDKKGGRSTWWLDDEPELLDRLFEVVDLPVRFIHVSRHPADNIATITRHGHSHDAALAWYLDTCEAVARIKARLPAEQVFDLRHEDLLAEPRRWLAALAGFLDLSPEPRWIEACAAVLRPRPNLSRFELRWTEAQRATLRARIPAFPWMRPGDDEVGEAR